MRRAGDRGKNAGWALAYLSAANVKACGGGRSQNAPMEPPNGTIKIECMYGARLKTRAEAALALVEHVGLFTLTPRICMLLAGI